MKTCYQRATWRVSVFLPLIASCLGDPNQPEMSQQAGGSQPEYATITRSTRLSIYGGRFRINGKITYGGQPAEGRLMNVRMVNSVFEDTKRTYFNPSENTDEFINRMRDYVRLGVLAFTVSLQGGFPGYEGAVNTAFNRDGSLKSGYLGRVARVIQKADAAGAVIILSLFYQRQDQHLQDNAAVRAAVINAVNWVKRNGYTNVILEIANEYGHSGYDRTLLRSDDGVASLIRAAKERFPALPVGASFVRNGAATSKVGAASDIILTHFNSTPLADIPDRVHALQRAYPSKPIICNEDERTGSSAAAAARASVGAGASYGLMLKRNQVYSFSFGGWGDDPVAYDRFKLLSGQ